MAEGEFIYASPSQPLPPEGVLPGEPVPVEPAAPEDLNPLVAADLHIAVMGDLASVQALRSELAEWLRERSIRHLGASAITEGEPVALSFKPVRDSDRASERTSSPEEQDFQRRLDTTIYDTLVSQGDDPTSRRFQSTMRRFTEDGIYTFRDLLVMGKKRSRTSHASSTFAPIRQAVIDTCPEEAEAWKVDPDIAQEARICPDLSKVTAGVFNGYPLQARWSVQDVLTRSAEEIVTVLWGKPQSNLDRYPEAAPKFQERARVYARDFLAANGTVCDNDRGTVLT
jgi:hypothetical protein